MSPLHLSRRTWEQAKEYNADLDLAILWLDEAAYLRSTLVARIADIANGTVTDCGVFDAATATAEILVYTYHSRRGDRHSSGHKYAIQAISLLASSKLCLGAAVGLFFDLVDSFCTINLHEGTRRNRTGICSNQAALRMMQNYDQILVRQILSGHRPSAHGSTATRAMAKNALYRISVLESEYGSKETARFRIPTRRSDRFRPPSSMFSDSVKLLHSMQKKRNPQAWSNRVRRSSSQWTSCVSGMTATFSGRRGSRDTIATMDSSTTTDSSGYPNEDEGMLWTYESTFGAF